MPVLHFNEVRLKEQLDDLATPARAALAAACAERLRPAYLAFVQKTGRGDPTAFESILHGLWSDLHGESMSDAELASRIELCMTLIPQEDSGPWVVEQIYAEDAGAALAYALRCRLTAQSQEAAWAARRAYEAVHHWVVHRESVDLNVPGAEARVLAHHLVQAELARQRTDLEDLRACPPDPLQPVIAQVRARATIDSKHVFKS